MPFVQFPTPSPKKIDPGPAIQKWLDKTQSLRIKRVEINEHDIVVEYTDSSTYPGYVLKFQFLHNDTAKQLNQLEKDGTSGIIWATNGNVGIAFYFEHSKA